MINIDAASIIETMKPIWAGATAAAAVVLAIAVVVVVVRIVRRNDKQAGAKLPEVIVGLLALGATIFFGVKTQNVAEGANPPGPTRSTGSSTPTSAASSPQTHGPSADSEPTTDVVKIVGLRDRPGVVEVTVRVSGPPSNGTRYLLIAKHNGGYQLKGKVDPKDGKHTIVADVRLADPGSWREFFVVGATPEAVEAWEGSVPTSLVEIPDGSRILTNKVPHQIPE